MKKSNLTYTTGNNFQENTSGFRLLFRTDVAAFKTTLIAFSKITKSFVIDLPIAYANIRV